MACVITCAEAQQFDGHNAFLVNGRRVNIPSYQVKAGDEIEVRAKSKGQLRLKAALEIAEQLGFVNWVEVDPKTAKGTFKATPDRADLSQNINESLVVALYSK